ncbi:MAG TPA: protein translocase SEC61 complex subunit gamma [Candidatus Norongarragalinales archaeon]|nr:protein translocase SEC61 complex subunit gamma [Candidatus Norongarragalinales archaeon]
MVDFGSISQSISAFIEQSQRVISITYKPKEMEFRQMAFTTALGMLLLGLIGFVITLISFVYK